MALGIICLILVLAVAYFHWAAGLFSATISMAFAVLASVLALGYHEVVVSSILGGKMADMANGMMICVIFAVVYGVGRIVFDMLIPGNVRLPLYIDKVGGALCGLVAGVFAVGTVAVAAQSLPFGPSVAGFTRYPLSDDKTTQVNGRRGGQQVDAYVRDSLALDAGQLAPPKDKEPAALLLPVDSIVVSYVNSQSRDGALASGGRSFEADHPDFLTGLFFQRLGIEPGAKHTALNIGGKQQVSVEALYAPRQLTAIDAELAAIRQTQGNTKPLMPEVLTADAKGGSFLLVVRTTVKLDAAETDNKLRFGMGQARLIVNGKQHFPIGTLYTNGTTLLYNRIDDFLLAEQTAGAGGITIDFTYQLNTADDLTADGAKLKPGAFFEFKRYGRVDLSDLDIKASNVPATKTAAVEGNNEPQAGGVIRKPPILQLVNPPRN